MALNNTQLGFLRGIGLVVVFAILNYLGDATHLNGLVSEGIAAIISALALAIEHNIESTTGKGLFGSTTVVRY